MLSTDLLLTVSLGYVALLFALAFYVDRRVRQGRLPWMRSPVVYTLSISVYCTSWTFYGADAALQRALDTVSPLAREKGVRVLPHAALGGIEVVANPDRLRQVLINLLSNAVKYNTAEDPEIRVDWHAGDRKLRIDVIDNGGGVNREEAEDIFSRFTRGSCAGHDQGAGLGLPISRAIMRRMGGDLLVEFNQDGSSFFRIHLPLVAQKTPAAPEAAAE